MTSSAGQPSVYPRRIALLRVDGTWVDDAALRFVDSKRVQEVVDNWVPLLRKHHQPDACWRWAEKTSPHELCYTKGVEHVMITHGGRVQGVMVTSLPAEPPALSQLPDLLYVEYVAAAPWNRELPGERRIFKAVGPLLIKVAVQRSLREGREGRLGLHSELYPDTVTFYRRRRLDSRGADPGEENREYFEGDSTWAHTFLNGGSHGT